MDLHNEGSAAPVMSAMMNTVSDSTSPPAAETKVLEFPGTFVPCEGNCLQ